MDLESSSTVFDPPAGSRLHLRLAGQILRMLKDENAEPGHRLIEVDLCQQFGVSRTPIRGALRTLAAQGVVEARAQRGYVVTDALKRFQPRHEPLDAQQEKDQQLLGAIARARNTGLLASDVTQQEICERFGVKLHRAVRVLRQLADLGLVERKPGNGWAFLPSIDTPRTMAETYEFRQLIEPQLVMLPGFVLDREWLAEIKARHLAFRKKRWRDTMSIEYNQMNSDFHDGLARCSNNHVLIATVQRLSKMRMLLNLTSEFPGRPHDSTAEHLQIIEALEAGDNLAASQMIGQHLTRSRLSSLHQALKPQE